MGKQGTLHPRKHPGSSAGVVPEHRHKQTDSNTHRQIQTHIETHTPNGASLPCRPPPPTPQLPFLLMEAILGMLSPSLGQRQYHPTHHHPIGGMSSPMPPAWSQVTTPLPSLERGARKSREGAFSQETEREAGILLPAEEKRRGLKKRRPEGALGRTWVMLAPTHSAPPPPPRGRFCGRAGW